MYNVKIYHVNKKKNTNLCRHVYLSTVHLADVRVYFLVKTSMFVSQYLLYPLNHQILL